MAERKNVNVDIDGELAQRARERMVATGESWGSLIAKLLKRWLDEGGGTGK